MNGERDVCLSGWVQMLPNFNAWGGRGESWTKFRLCGGMDDIYLEARGGREVRPFWLLRSKAVVFALSMAWHTFSLPHFTPLSLHPPSHWIIQKTQRGDSAPDGSARVMDGWNRFSPLSSLLLPYFVLNFFQCPTFHSQSVSLTLAHRF